MNHDDGTDASTRLACALIGADSLLNECGELLLAAGHRIEVVVSGSPAVTAWAQRHRLAVIDGRQAQTAWTRELTDHRFQWLFAITHLSVLPPEVLAMPSIGAVNFHDGPLPGYAGLNAPAWALMAGEDRYGITWHRMTTDIDAGDVLVERSFDVAANETSLSLNTRNFAAALDGFQELIVALGSGAEIGRPQDSTAAHRVFRRHDRPAGGGLLDLRLDAAEVDRMVRALDFGPYRNGLALPVLWTGTHAYHVTRAEVTDVDDGLPPGRIVSVGPDEVVVTCGADGLRINGLQTLTGQPVGVGDVLPALVPGASLPLLEPTELAEVAALTTERARHEAAQVAQLARATPLDLPWSRPANAPATRQRVAVPVPPSITEPEVVVALLMALARITGSDSPTIGIAADAPRSIASAALSAALVSPWTAFTPTPLDAPQSSVTIRAVADRVRGELDDARSHGPSLRSLIGREPELHRLPALLRGFEPVVGVRPAARAGDERVAVELVDDGGWWLDVDGTVVTVADATSFAASIATVAQRLADAPTTSLADLDIVAPADLGLLASCSGTVEHPVQGLIHEEFLAQVARTPHRTAVVFDGSALSYTQLAERAARIAALLRPLVSGREPIVGIHLDRGIDLVPAVLGVLQAGAAYLPLDPTYPVERLEHMVSDSGCRVVIVGSADAVPAFASELRVLALDAPTLLQPPAPAALSPEPIGPSALAYCIYTSGSTGLPKGVLVEHRNVTNFFDGMDAVVPRDDSSTWLAVTSLSFDISVLELLYTVCRGYTVVVAGDRTPGSAHSPVAGGPAGRQPTTMDFSLFYFSGDAGDGAQPGKYRLLLDGARFADEHGFCAVWTPERHFHDFGGLYPHPAVTGAAVAAVTRRVSIRAGSVVFPLSHPIRIAEEWSVVDNLSNGRVAVSAASGWHPDDFVLYPTNYADAKERMFEGIELVRRLWRGDTVDFPGVDGTPVAVRTLPRPVQAELPMWVTAAGNIETFVRAGQIGANLLSHLLGQTVEQVAPKVAAYRDARAAAGFDPATGIVTMMLHTYVSDDVGRVREIVREPLKAYLASSVSLVKQHAAAFPTFDRPAGQAGPVDPFAGEDFSHLAPDELDAILEFAYLRYFDESGLFGTPETCGPMVARLGAAGVDEIACLVDFGVDDDLVLDALPFLDQLRSNHAPAPATTVDDGRQPDGDRSIAALLRRHHVTHFQCTPSMVRMLLTDPAGSEALAAVEHLYVGGEALPPALASELAAKRRGGDITNMYGPTETTIWSTTWPVTGELSSVPIGTPIVNTRVFVLDGEGRRLPPGVIGHLWIGGAGVVRGYHERSELDAARFRPDPFSAEPGARMYATGDLARWRRSADAAPVLEFVGRNDFQVKLRGHRIELGEIESRLGTLDGVAECVVVAAPDHNGELQLVAYAVLRSGADKTAADLKATLRHHLPEPMVPSHVVVLDSMPLTPNGKLDRHRLPPVGAAGRRSRTTDPAAAATHSELERTVLATWREVLGPGDFDVDDNFFDVGGHSLAVVRLQRRLVEALGGRVALVDLYRYPTVRTFAQSRRADAGPAATNAGTLRGERRRKALGRRPRG